MGSKAFERKITLGLKILSGHYAGGVSKIDMSALPSTHGDEVPWGTLKFEGLVNSAISALATADFFKFLTSWNVSVISLMSDAVALDFILRMTRDWERRDNPAPGSGSYRAYQKSGVVLFDQLVLEYVRGDWSGSSDARVKRHLSTPQPEVLEPAPPESWGALIKEAVDEGKIRERAYTEKLDRRVVCLLYYRNAIRQMIGPENRSETIHVDHIIPKTLYDQEHDVALKRTMHHIANLALLPSDVHRDKSGRRLRELQSEFVKQSVAKYEDVPVKDFDSYSEVASAPALAELRGPLITHDMTTERERLLKDPEGFSYQAPAPS